jgi:hypothetical protein
LILKGRLPDLDVDMFRLSQDLKPTGMEVISQAIQGATDHERKKSEKKRIGCLTGADCNCY